MTQTLDMATLRNNTEVRVRTGASIQQDPFKLAGGSEFMGPIPRYLTGASLLSFRTSPRHPWNQFEVGSPDDSLMTSGLGGIGSLTLAANTTLNLRKELERSSGIVYVLDIQVRDAVDLAPMETFPVSPDSSASFMYAPNDLDRWQPSHLQSSEREAHSRTGWFAISGGLSTNERRTSANPVEVLDQQVVYLVENPGSGLAMHPLMDAPERWTVDEPLISAGTVYVANRPDIDRAPMGVSIAVTPTEETSIDRARLLDDLRTAFQLEPFEDGIEHEAERILESALQSGETFLWVYEFCTDVSRPVFAASLLSCLGRLVSPGTPEWRSQLIRAAVNADNVEIRDAAVVAVHLWRDEDLVTILAEHREPETWLRDYIEVVMKALGE